MSPQWKLRTVYSLSVITSCNWGLILNFSSIFSRLNESRFLKFLSLFLDFWPSVQSFATHSYVHPVYSASYFSALHLLNWILRFFETTFNWVPLLKCLPLVQFCMVVNVINLPSIPSTKQLMKINISHSTNLYVASLDISFPYSTFKLCFSISLISI